MSAMYQDDSKEKMVPIEPLPIPEVPKKNKGGRPRIPDEEKIKRRIAKGMKPEKDTVALTKNRKKAMEKARDSLAKACVAPKAKR